MVICDFCYIIYLLGLIASIVWGENPMYIVCHCANFPLYVSLASLIIIFDSLFLWGLCLYYCHKYDKRRLVFLSIIFLNLFYIYWYYIEMRIRPRRMKSINVSFFSIGIALIFNNCSIDKSNILSNDDLKWQIPYDTTMITTFANVNTIVKISQGERIRRYGIFDVRYINTVYSRLKVKNIYGESYLKYEVSKCYGNITFNLTQNGYAATYQNLNDSVISFTFHITDTIGSRIRSLNIQKGLGVINCTTN